MTDPAPSTPPAVPVLTRMVVFDPATGQPVVQNVPMFTKQDVHNILVAAATQLYDADPTIEPELVGKTNLEVMLLRKVNRAARGVLGEDELVLDRLIGKAISKSENKTMTVTYEDKLKEIDRLEKERLANLPQTPLRSSIMDAEVIDDSPLADIL
jgi:hypothetical protein